ncbi:MAG: PKD domain-containing protein, partial [Bacteroidota bacterium]
MKNLLLSFVLLFSFSALFAQTAQFTASVQSGCSPLVVNFDASASTGTGALSYAWDFGNGNTTAGPGQQQPGAAYVQPGTYTVSLTITDASGQTATQTQSITVFPNPTADFVVSDSLGCPPLNVAMTDLSLPANAPIVAWNWDFGDGNGSTQTNPSHSYAAGTYTLALIVTDANGCQDVVSYPNLITTYPGVSASFNPNGPLRTCNPTLAVSLQAQLQTQSNGPFSYQWDFGDGNTATGNPGQNNYQGSGSYDITLSVLDQSTGCSHLLTEPGLVELVDPNFSFAISDSAGCAPLTTQFSPQLPTNDPGVLLTWDFGDGNTLSGIAQNPSVLNPVYTYQNAGTFSPSLTVDLGPDLCVLSSTANNAITAGGLAQIDFTVSDSVACQPPLAVNFTPNAPGAQSWLWDFGDGTTDTTANPSHTYLNGGNYDVSLTIVNAQGCVQTFSEADLIRIQAPQAAFAHNLNDYTVFPELWDGRDASVICGGCLPLDITFTDQSASLTPIIDWQWDFGDGNA